MTSARDNVATSSFELDCDTLTLYWQGAPAARLNATYVAVLEFLLKRSQYESDRISSYKELLAYVRERLGKNVGQASVYQARTRLYKLFLTLGVFDSLEIVNVSG